ncbi:hypothetical protein [uncultured Friedmanniella sp.]|uniref:hypothetical protein n=1 Tax=uncultured Friedmanniella sp. TaxID=335381 RepID=UPI0035CB5261
MSTRQRFNPPPGWPPAPPDWTPPPGWAPDPSWGPVPEGWPLWVGVRANPRAWAYALASAAGWFVVLLLLGSAVAGGLPRAEAAGEIFGRQLFAGLVTGLIAWLRRSRWPVWLYAVVVPAISLLLAAVSTAGRMGGS